MRVSLADYSDASRVAVYIVCGSYAVAGVIVGISTRRFELSGLIDILALSGALLVCNGIILIYQRFSLPKIEAQLQIAVGTRDGPGFARHIIRREMAKRIQPTGGIAFSIGFLAAVIVCRFWH